MKLLFYCINNNRPILITNLDLMYDKKLKKETKHGLNAEYCLSHINTLYELNFVPGKLPLNKVHRDDFPDLKPI